MIFRIIVFYVLVFYLLFSFAQACEEAMPASAQEKFQQWESENIESYQYHIIKRCFCSPDYLKELQVTVKNGDVVEVVYAHSQQHVDAAMFNQQLSISEWYQLALDSMENENGKVVIRFSEDSLYPASIFIDPHVMRADDEYTVLLKKLSHN